MLRSRASAFLLTDSAAMVANLAVFGKDISQLAACREALQLIRRVMIIFSTILMRGEMQTPRTLNPKIFCSKQNLQSQNP